MVAPFVSRHCVTANYRQYFKLSVSAKKRLLTDQAGALDGRKRLAARVTNSSRSSEFNTKNQARPKVRTSQPMKNSGSKLRTVGLPCSHSRNSDGMATIPPARMRYPAMCAWRMTMSFVSHSYSTENEARHSRVIRAKCHKRRQLHRIDLQETHY